MELFFVIGKILVFIWFLYLFGSLISNYLFLPARIKEKRKQWTRKDPLTLNIQTKKYSAHVPVKDWFLLSVGPILFCGMGTFFMIALEARTAEAAVIKHTVAGVMYSMGILIGALVFRCATVSISVDEKGLSARTIFKNRVFIPWNEIVALEYHPNTMRGAYTKLYSAKDSIEFPSMVYKDVYELEQLIEETASRYGVEKEKVNNTLF